MRWTTMMLICLVILLSQPFNCFGDTEECGAWINVEENEGHNHIFDYRIYGVGECAWHAFVCTVPECTTSFIRSIECNEEIKDVAP